MLLNYLRDLVRFTSGLGINSVKVTGDNGDVTIEGSDETNKSLVIRGSFINKVPEFEGVCGLGDLEYLSKYVNAYKDKDDKATVSRKDKEITEEVVDSNGVVIVEDGEPVTQVVQKNVIETIHFKRDKIAANEYRVMDLRLLDPSKKIANIPWDITIVPSLQAINLFAMQAGLSVEKFFGVQVEDNDMFLTFGGTGKIKFASDVDGTIVKAWTWEIQRVSDILKLSSEAECVMSFSDKGVLKITLNTGLSEYNYILPARAA